MSEKSGTNENFIIFLIFIYRLKLKVRMLKMALTLDEKWRLCILGIPEGTGVAVKILDLRHLR
jgi:hypothetical protein